MIPLQGPPLNVDLTEQVVVGDGESFDRCKAFQADFFLQVDETPEQIVYSFSNQWGYVARAIFVQKTNIDGVFTRGSLICWAQKSGPVSFKLDDAGPEPELISSQSFAGIPQA